MLTHWTKKIIVEDGHTGSQVTNGILLPLVQFEPSTIKIYFVVVVA